jgi:hypothetical protein
VGRKLECALAVEAQSESNGVVWLALAVGCRPKERQQRNRRDFFFRPTKGPQEQRWGSRSAPPSDSLAAAWQWPKAVQVQRRTAER